jgi:hypothetical protein
MQASTSSIVISGSFYGDGSGLTGVTSTTAVSASYANFALSSSFASNATSSSFATNALSSSFATNALSSSFATNAATASIANDLIVRGKNNNPSTLSRGTIVRISGADGNNPLFDTASWINDANSANTLGMLSEDVATNGFANVVVQGKVEGINTNGMTAGAMLYLSSSGQYTTTIPPAPYHEVRLGQVLRVNTNQGSAYVSIDNGYELSELHDVDITNPVNGDLLVYRSGSYGQWVNESASEIGIATTGSLSGYTPLSTFNSFTSSIDGRVDALEVETGSLQNQINGLATTSSLTSLSSSIASTDLSQDNRLTALESVTGSINRNGLITTGSIAFPTQSITGSLDISGTITATSASFTYVNTVYETASVIYSSGSNQLGDASDDTQTLYGTVRLPNGPLSITGSLRSTGEIRTDGGVVVGTTLLVNNIENPAGSGDITINPSAFFKVAIDGNTEVTGSLIASGSQHQLIGNTTLDGNVDVTSGNLNVYSPIARFSGSTVVVTGSIDVTDGITGSLQGTSSYALQALSASYAPQPDVSYFATTGSNTFTGQQNIQTNLNVTQSLIVGGNSTFNSQTEYNGNVNYNADSFIKSGSQINFNIGDGLDGNYYRLSRKVSGEFGIVQDPGNYHLLDINTGSGQFLPRIDFLGGVDVTGSLNVRSGSLEVYSNTTTLNTDLYLTNSLAGQSNIVLGWGDNPTSAGGGSTINNYTGSLRVTGSANILSMPIIRPTLFGGGTDMQGYISGSGNILGSNLGGIFLNTGSLLFPKTQNNYLGNGSAILMNFTTSSLAGGHPQVSNNIVLGGNILINSNSGSSFLGQNAILGGSISSTQNFVTNTRPIINANNVIGGITLNHISSSINYTSNYNNSPVTINNHLSSSITNNSLTFANNSIFGGSSNTGLGVWVSGSQSSNVTRNIMDNLIGGKNIIVSSSFVSSSNSNLVSSLIYGQNLIVSGNHASTVGGSSFLGRYNDTTSLHLAQNIVFAVGTGTSAANRRTGLYVTSGSLVGVSGSLDVVGNQTVTGSVNISSVMKLQAQDPLPAGGLGELAVSSSNELYFHNGTTWNLIV